MSLPMVHHGKVRDIYDCGGGLWLMVASDRISAFDVVLAEPIPEKGRVLTAISAFWFSHLRGVAPSHMRSVDPADFPSGAPADATGRAMLVAKAEMLPIECVVRGYLAGSAWKEYSSLGTVHGSALPSGLREADRLPEPLFTPSTKATSGHDENISVEQAANLVGKEVVEKAAEISLAAYRRATEWSLERGIIIADTKFELGFIDGELALCDEVLTPDSSRFWAVSDWVPGATPPSLDKQPVRDWLESTGWDKTPPAPALPDDVVRATKTRYTEAYERLSGLSLSDWPGGQTGQAAYARTNGDSQ